MEDVMNMLEKIFGGLEEPVIEVERTGCPLYGFSMGALGNGILMDQEGNQCPLKDGYSPCHMEMGGESPCWEKCSYNAPQNKNVIKKLIKSATIFPREFNPKDKTSWGGMPLSQWWDYIINKAS